MRRNLFLALALAAGVTACGGSDNASSNDGGAGAVTTASGAVEQTTPESTDAPTSPSTEQTNTDDAPAAPSSGDCHVEVTGARTLSWDSTGGLGATGIDYWLSDEDRAQVPDDFGFFFILNCGSDAGLVTFAAGDLANEQTIPLGPGTYELPAATSGVGPNTIMSGGISIDESDGPLWGLGDGAVLVITEFDEDHIAGNFDFTASDVLSGTDDELQVTGTFDYGNSN
jgi:hypothetical protein